MLTNHITNKTQNLKKTSTEFNKQILLHRQTSNIARLGVAHFDIFLTENSSRYIDFFSFRKRAPFYFLLFGHFTYLLLTFLCVQYPDRQVGMGKKCIIISWVLWDTINFVCQGCLILQLSENKFTPLILALEDKTTRQETMLHVKDKM